MISLNDVSYYHGERCILDHISLTIPEGEHIAIMGPSGGGKTTLLRLILGLAKPQSGTVSVSGRLACVFQEPRLLPWCTAKENVSAVLSDPSAAEDRVMHYLEAVELAEAAGKYPDELSGGMQQRLAIARALAYEGDALLLDEPLKGSDPALRERLLMLLQQESAGKTLLLITHDPEDAHRLTDSVLNLQNGRLFSAES